MQLEHVIGYIRVSTVEQAREGASLDVQERVIREHAERNGWRMDKVFIEKGESAKTTDRTELQALLSYCKNNAKNVDAVLVYKIDRLTRKAADFYTLKGIFATLGVQLVSVSEPIQDDPIGRFLGNVLAGTAQLDNDIRSERCKNGMKEAVRNGRYVWKAPLGFRNATVDGKKNIEPENPQAEFVARGFCLVDKGYTPTEALRMLERDGFHKRNGKKITFSHWSKLLRLPLYAGHITAFGEVVRGCFMPIVDKELFERVQVILRRNSTKHTSYQRQREDFPLRSLLTCPCGQHLTASWSRGRHGNRYPYYRCTKCKGVNHKRDTVELKFIELLIDKSMDQNLVPLLRIAIEENVKLAETETEKRRRAAKRCIAALEGEQEQVVKKNLAGVYGDDMAKRLTQKAEMDIRALREELVSLPTANERLEHIVENGLQVMSDVRTAWKTFPLSQKQRFQSFLFPKGVCFNNGDFGTPETALILDLKTTFRDGKLLLVASRGIEPLLTA
jgi:site-specific DNA recombinase